MAPGPNPHGTRIKFEVVGDEVTITFTDGSTQTFDCISGALKGKTPKV